MVPLPRAGTRRRRSVCGPRCAAGPGIAAAQYTARYDSTLPACHWLVLVCLRAHVDPTVFQAIDIPVRDHW